MRKNLRSYNNSDGRPCVTLPAELAARLPPTITELRLVEHTERFTEPAFSLDIFGVGFKCTKQEVKYREIHIKGRD